MGKTLSVEIIAYAPTAFYHCTHCEVAWREMGSTNRIHAEQVSASLPDDLIREYQMISDWVRELLSKHCNQITVKVIDAASVEGFLKSLRYRVRQYPAVVVDGRRRYTGGRLEEAGEEIARLVRVDLLSKG